MATKRKKAKVPTPNIYWRGNRAYGDFRAYTDVGGGREALKAQGSTWGTSDPEIAGALFADRLRQLQELRKGRHGLASPKGTTLAVLVRDHLKMKAEAGTTSRSHMLDLEHRLKAAIEYFGSDRDPATIQAADVREWVRVLRGGGKRKEGTIRHYINALSGAFVRASELRVVPEGYNPVAAIPKGEKPGGKWKAGKAKYFTVADASLLLESARILEEREKLEVGAEGNRVNATPALHAILATFLLTGGRSAEVLGLDVEVPTVPAGRMAPQKRVVTVGGIRGGSLTLATQSPAQPALSARHGALTGFWCSAPPPPARRRRRGAHGPPAPSGRRAEGAGGACSPVWTPSRQPLAC